MVNRTNNNWIAFVCKMCTLCLSQIIFRPSSSGTKPEIIYSKVRSGSMLCCFPLLDHVILVGY